MLTRRRVFERPRRLIAASVMLGVVFAQIVTAAHACAIAGVASDPPVAHAAADAAQASCHDLAYKTKPNANVCESHCLSGQQVDTQSDAPTAAIAPRVALTIHVADRSPTLDASLPALGAAAPPRLRFSRLLI